MKVKEHLMGGLLAAGLASPAAACGPGALGVSRVIEIGGAPQVGLKSFPRTLDLADHEVVLTFDDGPSATTAQVLDALAAQCAKATFFLIGRNALDLPDTVRREIADGHTVGSHSFSHPWRMLSGVDQARAEKEIDDGDAAIQKASDGRASHFFRFPGFGDTPALLEAARRRGLPVFGVDIWASDWNRMTPDRELRLLMGRLRRAGSGIVLLHDIHRQTAAMIPALLAALKDQGFKLVHIVPGARPPALRAAPAGWTSQTAEINQDPHFSAPAKTPKSLPAPETPAGPVIDLR